MVKNIQQQRARNVAGYIRILLGFGPRKMVLRNCDSLNVACDLDASDSLLFATMLDSNEKKTYGMNGSFCFS